MRKLTVTARKLKQLAIAFDAGEIHDGWSGKIEARFNTEQVNRWRMLIKPRRD